jgi:cell division protein FtsL
MSFLQFALYYFTCTIVYDIIYTTVNTYLMNRQLEKIRKKLEEQQTEGTLWN